MRRLDNKLEEIETDEYSKESYFAVRQEITMTTTSLKKYIYFSTALSKAKNGDSTDGEYWKAQNPIVLVIYDRL